MVNNKLNNIRKKLDKLDDKYLILVKKRVKLVNSENWAKECLSLPLYPYMKLKAANKVISLIRKFYS